MKPAKAAKRYIKLFIPAMIGYSLSFPAMFYLPETLPYAMTSILALTPALCFAIAIWAIARFIKESDEYLRLQQSRTFLIAGAITLLVTFFWGMQESFAAWPSAPIILVVPLYFIIWTPLICWDIYQAHKLSEE